MRRANSVAGLGVLLIIICLSTCSSQAFGGGRVTIIPYNFRGVVLIVFDETAAVGFERKEDKIVYRVPSSGVLRTVPPPDEPFGSDNYYFEEADGTLKTIRYLYPAGGAYADKGATFDSIPSDSAEPFCMLDSVGTTTQKGKSIRYRSFLVERASEVDQLESQISKKLREL